MKRRKFTRVLLFMLAGVMGLMLYRSFEEAPVAQGVIVLDDLERSWLEHEAFQLDRPLTMEIEAVGSFEVDDVLAAYGWIVRRADHQVVWTMSPEMVERKKKTLAHINDSL